VRQGLLEASSLKQGGQVELGVAASRQIGVQAYVEASLHRDNLTAFARGYVQKDDYGALAGLRWMF
jgi:hypothetical protein